MKTFALVLLLLVGSQVEAKESCYQTLPGGKKAEFKDPFADIEHTPMLGAVAIGLNEVMCHYSGEHGVKAGPYLKNDPSLIEIFQVVTTIASELGAPQSELSSPKPPKNDENYYEAILKTMNAALNRTGYRAAKFEPTGKKHSVSDMKRPVIALLYQAKFISKLEKLVIQ